MRKTFLLMLAPPRGLFFGIGLWWPICTVLVLTGDMSLSPVAVCLVIPFEFFCFVFWGLLVWHEIDKEQRRMIWKNSAPATITAEADRSIPAPNGIRPSFISLHMDAEGVKRCPHCGHSVESDKNIESWERSV